MLSSAGWRAAANFRLGHTLLGIPVAFPAAWFEWEKKQTGVVHVGVYDWHARKLIVCSNTIETFPGWGGGGCEEDG